MQGKKNSKCSSIQISGLSLYARFTDDYEFYAMSFSNTQLGYNDIQMGIKKSVNDVICTQTGISMDNLYTGTHLKIYAKCKECMYKSRRSAMTRQRKLNEGTEFNKETAVGKKPS